MRARVGKDYKDHIAGFGAPSGATAHTYEVIAADASLESAVAPVGTRPSGNKTASSGVAAWAAAR